MIVLSPRLQELLRHPHIEPFYLVQMNGGTRLTSHISEITLSDGRVYSPGDLHSLDPPQLSSTVARDAYKVTIADPRMEYGAVFEEGLVGKDMEVRVGMIDPTTGVPETNVDNTFIIYAGTIDGVSYQIDTSSIGEALAVITCASPMANLEMAKPFHTSKDFIRQLNPADSSFDQIYQGAGPVQLRWGKT